MDAQAKPAPNVLQLKKAVAVNYSVRPGRRVRARSGAGVKGGHTAGHSGISGNTVAPILGHFLETLTLSVVCSPGPSPLPRSACCTHGLLEDQDNSSDSVIF